MVYIWRSYTCVKNSRLGPFQKILKKAYFMVWCTRKHAIRVDALCYVQLLFDGMVECFYICVCLCACICRMPVCVCLCMWMCVCTLVSNPIFYRQFAGYGKDECRSITFVWVGGCECVCRSSCAFVCVCVHVTESVGSCLATKQLKFW